MSIDDEPWEVTPDILEAAERVHEDIRQGRYVELRTPEDIDRYVDEIMA